MPIVRPSGVLTGQAIADWLTGQGADWTILEGPYVPDEPDQLTVVTMTGGPGLIMEQALDTVGFQLRTRGAQMNPGDASSKAYDLDYVVTTTWPTEIGGVHVNVMGRTGGGPVPFGAPDNGDRQTFVCTYYATVPSLI